MAEQPQRTPVPGAPSDNTTLVAVIDELRQQGFEADLRPIGDDGAVRCGACRAETPAADLEELTERRMEGASDPADMMLVASARCPACGTGGVLTLSYGPTASESDAAVVALLPRRDQPGAD